MTFQNGPPPKSSQKTSQSTLRSIQEASGPFARPPRPRPPVTHPLLILIPLPSALLPPPSSLVPHVLLHPLGPLPRPPSSCSR
eukprot:9499179-Pyramimonas_sp.AAC.1